MRIGIEAQRIFRKNKHGMDYVVLQEIKELQKMDSKNEYFIFVAPGEDICLEDTKNFHIIEIGGNFYPTWEQITLPKAVKELDLDMLHCTSNTAPIRCKVPLILTLHDIIFLEPRDKNNKSLYQNMGWFYRRLIVPKILKKCKRIITVSNFEMENIMTKLNIPKERMAMIYNGYNEWFKPTADTEQIYKKYIEEPGYFFFLGNTDPKKNTERTLMMKNVVMPGYIVNSDLPFIYNNAFAFLYTSLRESFGIPLLEAMACGVPVITSNTSSMPEIGGPDAIMVNPENPDEIAEKMLLLEEDDAFYRKQEEIGLVRAEQFSWQQTAEHLLNLYEKVYKQR